MTKNSAVLKKVAGIKSIPTLPEVMQEVLATVTADDSSATDLAAIISKDQAMCSRVLKMANSAFYAQSRKIFNIEDAIVVLGFDAIVQLMLATSVLTAFDSTQLTLGFSMYGLWKHSIATAVTSKMLAEKAGGETERNLAYTAGLLHDVGKLVLAHYFPEDYGPVFARLEADELYLYEAEREVLGFTHCDIGEWLFSRWNFPERLISMIINHHGNLPHGYGMDTESVAVRLANVLCNTWDLGNSGNKKGYAAQSKDYALFGLDDASLETLERNVREIEKEIDLFLKAMV
jgi:putative nucleotidyltransferase with HDIG domain